ncbi:PK beta-barrel-protein domain-containing protein-like protein [Jackrogersella minutella]|nr:PK beta-barrel-protein domain-containing protein-like protein [Jackrogersella minutella]
MSPASNIDLFAPFERDIILEIRTSKMKTMPGLKIETGIDKRVRSGRIPVSFVGLDADEHDLVFHGGPDKAIHGYCCSHYYAWQKEFPEAATRFERGGFGENFVTERMNERNVCIGDIVSIGDDGVLLQVSLPRQPCFKLNHRFQLRNFAPNTYKTSRTGWYYRVLHEGTVQAGDEIRLVERRWPKWTIERVQEYLHRTQDDAAMNEELAAIADMGDESRKAFERRVEKLNAKKKRAAAALNGDGEEDKEQWRDFKIVEKKAQTPRIASFILEAVKQDPEAGEKPLGAHTRLRLPNGLLRSYSIVSGTPNRFELGIALESPSRGGSAYFHNTAKEGDILQVGRITTDVKPAGAASSHVFIVGGIGITAFLGMLDVYRKIHWESTVHYGVRDAASDVPFRKRVDALRDCVVVKLYDGSKGERMDIAAIFKDLPWNSHVYVCGPARMMDEAVREVRARGLGEADVHFEAFAADTTGDPFEVEVRSAREKKSMTLQVGAEETLLEVLRKNFGDEDVPSSCEVGNCGTCKVVLRSGRVDHRGTGLLEDEKREALLSCVSRGIGKIAIEI